MEGGEKPAVATRCATEAARLHDETARDRKKMHVYGMMHAERTRAGDSVFLISYPLIISNLVPRYGNYRGIRYSYFVANERRIG